MGKVYLSTYKNYNAGGLTGDSDDILICEGPVGSSTGCTLSLAWNGDDRGLGSAIVDGYSVGIAPPLMVSSAAIDDEDAEDELLDEDDESQDILDDDEYTEYLYLPLINR